LEQDRDRNSTSPSVQQVIRRKSSANRTPQSAIFDQFTFDQNNENQPSVDTKRSGNNDLSAFMDQALEATTRRVSQYY
jgi:hypothetical protein